MILLVLSVGGFSTENAFATVTTSGAMISATANAGGDVDLVWSASITNATFTNYQVIRHNVTSFDPTIAGVTVCTEVSIATLSCTDSTGADTTTYYYRLLSTDSAETVIADIPNEVSATVDSSLPVVTGSTTNITNGGNTELTATDQYTESGTATDNNPASPTVSVQSGSINTSVVGLQTVTYQATDAVGNVGTNVISTTVVDTTNPLFDLVTSLQSQGGSFITNIEVGIDTYVPDTFTNQTDISGILSSVVSGDTVNESVIAQTIVTYTVTDNNSNTSIVTETVNVVDTTNPSIALTGSTPVTIELNIDTYSEQGAVVSDNDPAVTTVAVVGGDVVDESTIGTYTVTYNGNDPTGNSATQVTRTVNVVDTTNPSIVLNGETPTNIQAGVGTYSELGAVVSDNDPTVTTVAVVGGDVVDESTVAVYTVTYNGNDPTGNSATQVTRTVNVIDTIIPVLTLVGSTPIIHNQYDPYVEAGATCFDNYDGQIDGNVVVGGDTVNVNVVGTYNITFDCDDASSNSASQLPKVVSVVDAIMPLISPTAGEPITLLQNDSFTAMDYVVCVDAEDGVIVAGANFGTDGGTTINTANRGVQIQDYTCTDAGSNIELESVEFLIQKESGAGSFSTSSSGQSSGSNPEPTSLSDIPEPTTSLSSIPTLSFQGDIGDADGSSITDLFSNLFSNRIDSETGKTVIESVSDSALNSFSPEPSTTGEPVQGGFNLVNTISDSLNRQPSDSSSGGSPISEFISNLLSSIFG